MFWDLIIIFGIAWIVQSFFAFMQNLYASKIISSLSEYGKVFTGKNRGFMKTKILVFAAIDSNGCIIKANRLIPAKIFRMPKILPFDELSGVTLAKAQNMFEFNQYTVSALGNLSENYSKFKKHSNKSF